MKKLFSATLALLYFFLAPIQSHAGKVIAANDDWPLHNTGFARAPDTSTFIGNVASWFTGGGAGEFHAYSAHFTLTGSSLASAMADAGHTWTTGTGIPFDLPTLLSFDGVFFASGPTIDFDVLADYVNAGGNVYIAAGTSSDGAAAGYWNPFVNRFGLEFQSSINVWAGNIAINSSHEVFDGVGALYHDRGQGVLDITSLDSRSDIIATSNEGIGLFGAYASPVPEPTALTLLTLGSLALLMGRRRR